MGGRIKKLKKKGEKERQKRHEEVKKEPTPRFAMPHTVSEKAFVKNSIPTEIATVATTNVDMRL